MKTTKFYQIHKVIIMFIILFSSIVTLRLSAYADVSSYPMTSYTYTGYKIRSGNTLLFYPHEKFGDTSISHFNEALFQWNSNAGTTLMKRSLTPHSSMSYYEDDGKCYIYRVNMGDTGWCGITRWRCAGLTSSNYITEADTCLNMCYKWANSQQSGCYDVWTVFLHESGHAAGLGDVNFPKSRMHGSISTNYLGRYLGSGDILGIQNLY